MQALIIAAIVGVILEVMGIMGDISFLFFIGMVLTLPLIIVRGTYWYILIFGDKE